MALDAEEESHPAAPLSPEETKTVMPSTAACSQRLLRKVLPAEPSHASQRPKLVLMTGARFLSTIYCAERSTPSVVLVDLETTNLIVAFRAIAPDHSTSRSASVSSFSSNMPGSGPLRITCGLLAGKPKDERNCMTSLKWILERATIAMDWPLPLADS